MSQVNVFSPTRHNRVRLNSRVTVLFEEREECFPHLRESEFFGGCGVAEESVASALVRAGFTAGFLLGVLGPVVFSAFWTKLPHEAFLLEEWKTVICFCKRLGQGFQDSTIAFNGLRGSLI